MSTSKKKVVVPPLTCEESQALIKHIEETTRHYAGQFDELEKALGMLVLGRLVGWKVLMLIHNKRTIRKYEKALGINIREEFPEEGPFTHKSVAYSVIKKVGNFWKGVSGELKIEGRRELSK
jgi:hypothetical protein